MVPRTPRDGNPCIVPQCSHHSLCNRKVSWHYFPKEDATRELWIQAIIQDTALPESWRPKRSYKICGAYFSSSGKRQYMDKVPRYVSPGTFMQAVPGEGSPHGTSSLLDISMEVTIETSFEDEPTLDVNADTSQGHQKRDVACNTEPDLLEVALHDEHQQLSKDQVNLQRANADLLRENVERERTAEVKITSIRNANAGYVEVNATQKDQLAELRHELAELQSSICDMEVKLEQSNMMKKPSPKPSDVLSDDTTLHFYTGFVTLERFERFWRFVEAGYEDYQKSSKGNSSRSGRRMVFSVRDQLIVVLMRLRLGLLEQELAYRYQVSLGYISELCSFWIAFLSECLQQTPIWPSKEIVTEFMPASFKDLYPTTRIILDCTELYIETPSDLRVQSDTYSAYKSHNTAKGLIDIAPNGFITFVSNLAPGRISDKALVKQSGLYELLEPGDSVMADRGFLIAEDVAQLNVELNIPPFLNGASQLSVTDVRQKELFEQRAHLYHCQQLGRTMKVQNGAISPEMDA
ncbi:uncharacterized protein LOC135395169 [Ornithodoros turicata]|uniref:uncharacterized protein LOC135395169 n=1 Tax=Ornithodoros turicata TaxID=34597 RepID=UPI003138A359